MARRLRLTLGGRYDDNRVSALPSDGTEIKASFHKFSPKVGASYRLIDSDDPIAPQLSVYAQYSRAFKPPRAPADLSVALDPANPLKPENITNYEGGLKATVLQGTSGARGLRIRHAAGRHPRAPPGRHRPGLQGNQRRQAALQGHRARRRDPADPGPLAACELRLLRWQVRRLQDPRRRQQPAWT